MVKGRFFMVFLWEEEPGSESHCPHTMGLAETHKGKSPRLLRPNPDSTVAPTWVFILTLTLTLTLTLAHL